MSQNFFADESTLVTIKAPASISASGNTPGTDLANFDGKAAVILAALNTAGTLPSLAVKLQTSTDSNLVGTITFTGTGNGKLTEVCGGPDSLAENITVTFSSATAFSVSGSVTGAMGSGTVGTRFTCPQISFLVFAGATAFINNDAFTVPMSARVYTDVPNGAFTGFTTVAGFQRVTVVADNLSRYLRGAYTIGGTNSPAYTVAMALMALKQYLP